VNHWSYWAGSEIYTGTEARSPMHNKTSNRSKKETETDHDPQSDKNCTIQEEQVK
jgi:hypothetical protein